jgi:hypothetical protein
VPVSVQTLIVLSKDPLNAVFAAIDTHITGAGDADINKYKILFYFLIEEITAFQETHLCAHSKLRLLQVSEHSKP